MRTASLMSARRSCLLALGGLLGANLGGLPSLAAAQSFVGSRRSAMRYRILVEVDLASRTRDVGKAIEDGVRQAVLTMKQEIQAQVELVILNHHGNADRALDLLNQVPLAIPDQPVLGIIGGGDANLAPLVARWATRNALPYGIAWASNPRLLAQVTSELGSPAPLLRYAVTDDRALDWLSSASLALDKRRWGLLLANDGLGRATYDNVVERSSSPNHLELVGVQWHSRSAVELESQYELLRARGAQMIFLAAQPPASLVLANVLAKRGSGFYPPVLCSSNAWHTQIVERTGGAIGRCAMSFYMPIMESMQLPIHPAQAFAAQLTEQVIRAEQNLAQQKKEFWQLSAQARWQELQVNTLWPQDFSAQQVLQTMRYNAQGQLRGIDATQFFASSLRTARNERPVNSV